MKKKNCRKKLKNQSPLTYHTTNTEKRTTSGGTYTSPSGEHANRRRRPATIGQNGITQRDWRSKRAFHGNTLSRSKPDSNSVEFVVVVFVHLLARFRSQRYDSILFVRSICSDYGSF
ncbi:uncharacterized protein G2W53_029633 [Senna tora]|uniref:Uncharacterized protein n=1 Tax=Senna tora TaxID=362788 RepID=A0A834T4R5_9FABA|nr:uncharacterized protein G2W53_029633 [Senna tora]